ncbi:nuclease-related domain-containing protein [Bacillaceae bacterium W0354]
MILRNHVVPINLLYLQVYKKRISKNHYLFKKILEFFRREMSGFIGEKRIDYPLNKLDFKHAICHSLRLPYFEVHFQIDTLLLTPRFFLIIEVKNYSGIISFDPSVNKMIRTLNGKVEYYDDPLTQAEEQNFQLRQWLRDHGVPEIPIIHIVVFSNPEAILKINPSYKKHMEFVVTIHHAAHKIRELSKMHQTNHLSYSDVIKIGNTMIAEHTLAKPTIITEFNFEKNDFLKGVICPNCGSLPINWNNRSWECWNCKGRFSNAHLYTIKDYYLLNGPTISKRQYTDFTQINNLDTASYHLKRMKLDKQGNTHQLQHLLNYNYETDFDYLFNLKGYA